MKRLWPFFFCLLFLFPETSQAALPGSCGGITTSNLFICIPPSGQSPWYLEYVDGMQKIDAHAGTLNAHGATSANTPDTPVARDGSGNIAVTTVTGNVVGNVTGNVTGSAGTAGALAANGTNCSGNNVALGIDAAGNGECAQPAFSMLSGTVTDAQVPNDITITSALPLTAGAGFPLTGQLFLDNLGIEAEESDTNPVCASGNFSMYADASEGKWKKCEDGVASDIGATAGASGDITDVWQCGTGDCNLLTATVGDIFDAGGATASRPATRNSLLPATCSEGQLHHFTTSGGSETYVCTDTNVWTKLLAGTDNIATATALAANPTDCGANQFATTIGANGNLTCASVAGTGKAVADPGANGMVARTGDGTASARTITGTAGNITITNGDGVAGNPTVNVDTSVVQTDQANTWTSGAQDMGAALSLKLPTSPGAVPTAAGLLMYDSTSHTLEAGINGSNKTVAMTDSTVAAANALAANGANCSAGNFPLGVDTTGAVEGCADVTTQSELDSHAASTATHGATALNTVDTIVARDGSGNFAAGTITAALTGNATTATALAANGANCTANDFALGVDAGGVAECAQPAFTNISGAVTDAQVPDTITASNYLPLAGGTLTGQLLLDNLGIEAEESDTNPTCASGNFSIYADASELKWKKCEDGVASDLGAVSGSSGDISDVWTCSTGDCSTLTATTGDTLNAASADSVIPQPLSTTLPATCTEGFHYQDTDSTGTETYVCTATDVWTKLLGATDNSATATALAANGANCSAGSFPLGVDASGAVETCTDAAIQTELDDHAALTSAHGATSANTASRIVTRDPSGNFAAQTVTASLAGNATTATALAANGANCGGTDLFPKGVDAAGAVESCTDVAAQGELDTHAALTSAHSATSANTASRIVTRDPSGNFSAGTVTAALTGNATTATALAADPTDCASGEFTNGINADGSPEGCANAATQSELDTHAGLTTAHGATTANTANTIPLRNADGGLLVELAAYTAGALPTCDAASAYTDAMVTDGANAEDCDGGGGSTAVRCSCNGTAWAALASSATVSTQQETYDASGATPTITAGPNGFTKLGFNSLAKADKLCNAAGTQCRHEFIDESGLWMQTFTQPLDYVQKLYADKSWELKSSADVSLLKITDAGLVTGTAKLERVLAKSAADVDVTGTTETTIFSYTVPANTLGTDSCVRVTVQGTVLNDNTGATRGVTLRLKYGGTATSGLAITGISLSATPRSTEIIGTVCGNDSVSSQRMWHTWTLNDFNPRSASASPSINSAADADIVVSVELDFAHAGFTFNKEYAVAELLP